MILHKLKTTCDCGDENCRDKGDGAVVTLTISANDLMDIDLIANIMAMIEPCADRVESTTVKPEEVQLIRAAMEDCYQIPKITEKMMELLEQARKEAENPFDNLEDLELKEIG